MTREIHIFSQIFLHVTWHVSENEPAIQDQIEDMVHETIRQSCDKIEGVTCIAVNGMPDHIHIVIRIEPTVLLSESIGKIKGSSAYRINQQLGRKTIQWQRGYGVVSFSKKHIDSVVGYVKNQKKHHHEATTIEILETIRREFT